MKKYITTTIILAILCAGSVAAQSLAGQWSGTLRFTQFDKLRFVLNITADQTGYSATMDSPDQGAVGIPIGNISATDTTLEFSQPKINMSYSGVIDGDTIRGTFTQMSNTIPLTLSRSSEPTIINRPQEPKPPYPYTCIEVSIPNTTDTTVTLSGTLTLPQGRRRFPIVVLVSGSGPQDRNEQLYGHKPFLVLADYLTRNGVGVLRYDDRGTAKSTGNFATATISDFASDARSAVEYLENNRSIGRHTIGIIGHSEGGIIAPMLAAEMGRRVGFVVMMAGVGMPGDKLILLQKQRIEEQLIKDPIAVGMSQMVMGGAYKFITDGVIPDSALPDTIRHYFSGSVREPQLSAITSQLTSRWYISFLRCKPADFLSSVKCPVLALNGSKDLQVPAPENLPLIDSLIRSNGNKSVTTREFEGLNHLFQHCESGMPTEYSTIEQTLAPEVLSTILEWIKAR